LAEDTIPVHLWYNTPKVCARRDSWWFTSFDFVKKIAPLANWHELNDECKFDEYVYLHYLQNNRWFSRF